MNKPRKNTPAGNPAKQAPKPKAAAKPMAKTVAPMATAAAPLSALETDQAAAFLREVDDAMRAEKWLNIWQKWRWPAFGGLAALVLGVAGWQAYGAWQAHQYRSVAAAWDDLGRLPTEAELAASLPKFNAEAKGGYLALGQLAQAAQAATPAEKIAAYRAVAADASQPAWLQAFGQLNAALVLLETNPAEGQAQLELLAKTEIGEVPLPTVPLALELLALNAMAKQDNASAKAYTQKLLGLPQLGGTLTPALRTRALQRLGALQE